MVAVPPDTPVTIPVPLMVAIIKGVLDHVPPVVTSPSGVVMPAHIAELPVIAAGEGETVIIFVTVHPAPSE